MRAHASDSKPPSHRCPQDQGRSLEQVAPCPSQATTLRTTACMYLSIQTCLPPARVLHTKLAPQTTKGNKALCLPPIPLTHVNFGMAIPRSQGCGLVLRAREAINPVLRRGTVAPPRTCTQHVSSHACHCREKPSVFFIIKVQLGIELHPHSSFRRTCRSNA